MPLRIWIDRAVRGVVVVALSALPALAGAGEPVTARHVAAPDSRFSTAGFVEVAPVTRAAAAGLRVRLELPDGGEDTGDGIRRARLEAAVAWRDERALILLHDLPAVDAAGAMLAIEVPLDDGGTTTVRLPAPARPRYRPDTEIFLLVDDSNSMRRTDPERLRVEAIRRFVERAAAWPHVRGLAIGSFTDRALLLLPLTRVEALPPLSPVLENLVSLGRTDMDMGMRMALRTLQQSPSPHKAIVLLSDGEHSPGRYQETHAVFRDLGWPVHAIGLSHEADRETLARIAGDTGGSLHEALTADALDAVFAAVVEALKKPVLAVAHDITGEDEAFTLDVDQHLGFARLTYVGRPGFDLSAIHADSGQRYTLRGGNVVRLRLGSGGSRWRLELPEAAPAEAHGMLRVDGTSALALLPFPVSITPDGRLRSDVLLTGTADAADVHVTLRADWPGGSAQIVMGDDGAAPDLRAGDGVYTATLALPAMPPDTLRVRMQASVAEGSGTRVERMAELYPALGTGHAPAPRPARLTFPYPTLARRVPLVRDMPEPVRTVAAWPRELPGFEPVAWPVAPSEAIAARRAPPVETAPAVLPDVDVDAATTRPAMQPAPVPADAPLRSIVPPDWRLPLAILLWCLLLALLVWWLLRTRVNRMVKYVAASVLAHVLLALLTLNFMIETGVVDLETIAPSISVQLRAMEQGLGVEILPPAAPPVEVADAAARPDVERLASADAADAATAAPAVPLPGTEVRPAAVEPVAAQRPEPDPVVVQRDPAERRLTDPVPEPAFEDELSPVETVMVERERTPDEPRPLERPDRPMETAETQPATDTVARFDDAAAARVPQRVPVPAVVPVAESLLATPRTESPRVTAPRTEPVAEPLELAAGRREEVPDRAAPRQDAPTVARLPADAAETTPPPAPAPALEQASVQPRETATPTAQPHAGPTPEAMLPVPLADARAPVPLPAPTEADMDTTLAEIPMKHESGEREPDVAATAGRPTRRTDRPSGDPVARMQTVRLPAPTARARDAVPAGAERPREMAQSVASESVRDTRPDEARSAVPSVAAVAESAFEAPTMPAGRQVTAPATTDNRAAETVERPGDHAHSETIPSASGEVPVMPVMAGAVSAPPPVQTNRVAEAVALIRSASVQAPLLRAPQPAHEDSLGPRLDTPAPTIAVARTGDADHRADALAMTDTAPARAAPAARDAGISGRAEGTPRLPATGPVAAAVERPPAVTVGIAMERIERQSGPVRRGPVDEPSSADGLSMAAPPMRVVEPRAGEGDEPAVAAALAVARASTAHGDSLAQSRTPAAPLSQPGPTARQTSAMVPAAAGASGRQPELTDRRPVAAHRGPLAGPPALDPGIAPMVASATPRTAAGSASPEMPSRVAAARPGMPAVPVPERARRPMTMTQPTAAPTAATDLPAPRAAAAPAVALDRRGAEIGLRAGHGPSTGSFAVDIPLARYQGDWDSAPTAMLFLAHNLEERTGLALEATSRVVGLDSPDLHRMPFVYMTGHRDFRFTDAEVANLRRYLEGGGHVWADDSAHFGDEAFDRAFRREIQRVLPDRAVERLDPDFEAFRTGYDLTRGYKDYAIPPGDKYRQDYLEGIRIDDRVAVVYSRNDYGDGLEIDPNTHPIMESLTDLSPREMQEGALRMGINLVLYFLAGSGRGPDALSAMTADLDTHADVSVDPVPAGTVRDIAAFADAGAWRVEDWADPAAVEGTQRELRVTFSRGEHNKVVLARELPEPLALTPDGVLLLEAGNRMPGGARLALGFHAGGRYLETRPAFLKPGDNTAIFPLDDTQFKSEATDWEFRDRIPAGASIDALTILIYTPQGGTVTLRDLRLLTR